MYSVHVCMLYTCFFLMMGVNSQYLRVLVRVLDHRQKCIVCVCVKERYVLYIHVLVLGVCEREIFSNTVAEQASPV